jgi:hypothetical protein
MSFPATRPALRGWAWMAATSAGRMLWLSRCSRSNNQRYKSPNLLDKKQKKVLYFSGCRIEPVLASVTKRDQKGRWVFDGEGERKFYFI